MSQSFFGELAARFVGDALRDWLSDDLAAMLDPEEIRTALDGYLRRLTAVASEAVRRFPLPAGIPSFLADVLEQKRSKGSESTFVCGRIDLPGRVFPTGRLVLAWMGDSRLRLWDAGGEASAELGESLHTAQRWSTQDGPVGGEPHLRILPLAEDGRRFLSIAAYSDGLATFDSVPGSCSNLTLEDLITAAGESAVSDDISFFELWIGDAPLSVGAEPLAAPVLTSVKRLDTERAIRAAWRPMPAATAYRVELRDQEAQTWQVAKTRWKSPPLRPHSYRLRVRAVHDEDLGRWSDWATVNLSPPVVTEGNQEMAIAETSERIQSRRTAATRRTLPFNFNRRRRCSAAAAALVICFAAIAALTVLLGSGRPPPPAAPTPQIRVLQVLQDPAPAATPDDGTVQGSATPAADLAQPSAAAAATASLSGATAPWEAGRLPPATSSAADGGTNQAGAVCDPRGSDILCRNRQSADAEPSPATPATAVAEASPNPTETPPAEAPHEIGTVPHRTR